MILRSVSEQISSYSCSLLFSLCSDFVTYSDFNPPSGSVLADIEGAVNFTTLSCTIFSEDNMMRTVMWSVMFKGDTDPQALTDSKIFLIHGDLQEGVSFQNKLTVLNLTPELDGVIVCCGTEEEPKLANFTLRIYCRCHDSCLHLKSLYSLSGPPLFKVNQTAKYKENTKHVQIDLGLTPMPFPEPSTITLSFEKKEQRIITSRRSNDSIQFNGSLLLFDEITRDHAGIYFLTATNYRLDNTSREVGTFTGKFTLDVICKWYSYISSYQLIKRVYVNT